MRYNSINIIKYFLSLNNFKITNCNLLMYAIEKNNDKVVKLFLEHPNFDINMINNVKLTHYNSNLFNWRDTHGKSHIYAHHGFFLHHAIKHGYINIVKLLLEHGMDEDKFINGQDASDGCRPLHVALVNNRDEIIELLLSKPYCDKIQVNLTDAQCATSLMRACQYYDGNIKIIQRLIEFDDCNVLEVDPHGWNCLMYAAKEDKTDVIKYLYGVIGKTYGYNSEIVHDFVNQRSTYMRNETAYLIAKRKGFSNTVDVLVKYCKCNVE